MLFKNTLVITSLFLFSFSSQLTAQDEQPRVSDQELETFVEIYEEVQVENQKVQEKMVSSIQKEGMEVARFQEISEAEANPNAEADVTEEERAKVSKLNKEMETIQMSFQERIKSLIESKGMTVERYQAVYTALQTDKALQEKFGEMMNG